MSFESCFGGFAGSKSAPAAMGGLPTFAAARTDGEIASEAPVRRDSWQLVNSDP
jgi:hypothetical protein